MVDPRDAAAAGAYLKEVEHRHADRKPGAALEAVHPSRLVLLRHQRLAAGDGTELGRGAAHVEAQEVVLIDKIAPPARRGHAAGRAGFEHTDREFPRHVCREHPATGVHDIEFTREATFAQALADLGEIGVDQGLYVGIGRCRTCPLVLLDLRQHIGGQRHREFRGLGRKHLSNGAFVLGIGVGIQQAHGHRNRLRRPQLRNDRAHLFQRRAFEHRTFGRNPLGNLHAQRTGDQGLRVLDLQVVDVVAEFVPHLEHVAEPAGGDERGDRSAPFDQRVDDERGPVHERRTLVQRRGLLLGQKIESVEDPFRRVARRGERLFEPQRAGDVVDGDEIGERAADIRAYAQRLPGLCHPGIRACGCVRPTTHAIACARGTRRPARR